MMTDFVDAICDVFHDHWIDHETHDTAAAAQAVKDLIIARIPPLVWEEDQLTYTHWTEDRKKSEERTSSLHWSSHVPGFSAYYGIVKITDDRFKGKKDYTLTFGGDKDYRFPTLEAAKAAANAHHVAQLCKGMGIE